MPPLPARPSIYHVVDHGMVKEGEKEKEEEKIHVRIMELASLCTPAKMVPVKVADEEAKQQAKKERRQQEKERRQASKGKGKGQGKKGKGKARAWSEVKCRDCNQWHLWPECSKAQRLLEAFQAIERQLIEEEDKTRQEQFLASWDAARACLYDEKKQQEEEEKIERQKLEKKGRASKATRKRKEGDVVQRCDVATQYEPCAADCETPRWQAGGGGGE